MSLSKHDRMFKAFADPTRLRILHLLTQGELCVCDIVDAMRVPQARVSRHLATLRSAGLVKDRKNGLWRHYSLVKAEGGVRNGLLGCLGSCFDEVGSLRRDIQRLKTIHRRKKCG